MVIKFNHSNCDKTQKVNLRQNSKTQFVINFKNSNCDKTQIVTNLRKLKLSQN